MRKVAWSPLTNHQWPGTFSRHTLLLPPTEILQKSKVPFFILQSNSGPCLFLFIWHSWRPPRVAQVKSVCYKNKREREREIFWFSLSERKFWNIVQWCRKSFERLWERFCLHSVCESVGWTRGLHVASIQNGELPHPACKYLLFLSLSKLFGETLKLLKLKRAPWVVCLFLMQH